MKTALTALLLALLITAGVAEAQDRDMKLMIYDVSTLTSLRHSRHAARLGIRPTMGWEEEYEEDDPMAAFEGDMLADLIRNSVTPACWDEGGDVSYRESGILIVKAWPEVLSEVSGLLSDLENEAARRVHFTVEVREYPAESYAKLPSGPISAEEVGKLPPGTLRETASGEAWPGFRAAVEITNRVRYVQDYDVEIAQGSNISDPITATAEEGLALELTPHLTSTGREIILETRVQHGQLDSPMRTVEQGVDEEYFAEKFRSEERFRLGVIELPSFRQSETVTTTLLPAEGTLAIPVLTGGKARLFLVSTKLIGTRNSVVALSLDALSHRGREFLFGLHPESEEQELLVPQFWGGMNESPSAFGGPEDIMDHLTQTVTPWYWEEENSWITVSGPRLLLSPGTKPEVRSAVLALLGLRETERLIPVQIDLEVYSVTGRVSPGEGKSVTGGEAILDHAISLSTISGRMAGCLNGRTFNFVADYDVEVAQEARIADPIIGQSFGGLVANLTPRLSRDRQRVQLDLDVLLADVSGPRAFDSKTQFLGPVEQVDQRRAVLRTQIEMPTGSTYVLDAGPDPARPGRRIAVQVRAKASLPK